MSMEDMALKGWEILEHEPDHWTFCAGDARISAPENI